MKVAMLFIISNAMAETGHGGGIGDLKFYLINFAVFLVIFFWKILPMIKNHFREQHLLMKNHFHTASEKLRLAKVENESVEKNLEDLDKKVADMRSSNARDLDVYRLRFKKEMDDKATTLEKDFEYQAEFEVEALNSNMLKNIVDQIADSVERGVKNASNERVEISQAMINKAGTK